MGKNKYMEKLNFNELISNNILPVIPLRGKVAFPHANISFEVGRSKTLKAVEKATATDKIVFILTQRKTEKTDVTPDDLYSVGFYDYIEKGVCIVEWSENILDSVPSGAYYVKIERSPLGENERIITIEA